MIVPKLISKIQKSVERRREKQNRRPGAMPEDVFASRPFCLDDNGTNIGINTALVLCLSHVKIFLRQGYTIWLYQLRSQRKSNMKVASDPFFVWKERG